MDHQTLKKFLEEDAENCRVLVVGDVMLDKYYFGEVTRISPEAPVPINRVSEVTETLGGAANVAHNLALLGCKTFLLSRIGEDYHGENFSRRLSMRRVDGSGIIKTSQPTTTKIRIISGHQQMLRLDFEDTTEISGDDEKIFLNNFHELLPEVDAVIISDYGKGLCTEKICREVIAECRTQKKIITVDPKSDDWKKYSGANFITPNLKEFNAVLPKKIPNSDAEIESVAAEVIEKFDLRGLVVTRSAAGLSLIDGEKISHVKAKAQEVFDVSGAGDTVIAVFTLALAGALGSEAAAYLANMAAGVVVAKVGTYAVSLAELLEILDK